MTYRSFQSEGGKVALAVVGPLQPLMGNGEVEVFFDPVAMGLGDEGLESAVSVLGPGLVLAGGCGDPCQPGFGGPQQILPLAGALLAQSGIEADQQAFAGEQGAEDLPHRVGHQGLGTQRGRILPI